MATQKTEMETREIFRAMDAEPAQDIREAYYKTVDGIFGLIDQLQGAKDAAGNLLFAAELAAAEKMKAALSADLNSFGRTL